MQSTAADTTYANLPYPGETDPAKLAPLGLLTQRLGIASATQRSKHIGGNSELLNSSQNLYLYGREDGFQGDTRMTVNLIQGAINTFDADACRVPASIVLKSLSANEDGPWILIKPFTFHAPTDPATGQPAINPNTGMPYVDVELQLFGEIPEEIVDLIPSKRRYCVNTENVVKHYQTTFDIIRRDVGMDRTIRQFIHAGQLVGWPMGLFEWDPARERPEYKLFPSQQWYPDPVKYDVETMNWIRLDNVCDVQEAKRLWPKSAPMIDKYGSKSVNNAPGSMGYSDLFAGGTTFEAPVVTLVHMWMRNQHAPMTLQESLDTGFVTITEEPNEPPATGPQAEAEGETGEGLEQGGETPQPQNDSTTPPAIGADAGGQPRVTRKITHAHTKADLTASFEANGNPAQERHEQHPEKLVIVQWMTIQGEVVPGTYIECPHWDIPVFMNKNVPIMDRPFAQPETERMRAVQYGINTTESAMMDHSEWFRGPAGFMYKDMAEKIDPDFVNGHAKPNKIFMVEGGDNPGDDIRTKFLSIAPPPMPEALPLMAQNLKDNFQLVANQPSVRQGTPPPGVTAARAIEALTEESQGASSAKSQYAEIAIKRMGMLGLHGIVNWLSLREMMRMNRSVPQPVVEKYIIPFARSMLWDMEVSLPTGAGTAQAKRQAQVRADFQLQLIDKETALDELDYDSEEVKRREKAQRDEMAQEQAKIQGEQQAAQMQMQQQAAMTGVQA